MKLLNIVVFYRGIVFSFIAFLFYISPASVFSKEDHLDYYAILDVEENASQEIIEQAFEKKLVEQFSRQGFSSELRFTPAVSEVIEAYVILTRVRPIYDRNRIMNGAPITSNIPLAEGRLVELQTEYYFRGLEQLREITGFNKEQARTKRIESRRRELAKKNKSLWIDPAALGFGLLISHQLTNLPFIEHFIGYEHMTRTSLFAAGFLNEP